MSNIEGRRSTVLWADWDTVAMLATVTEIGVSSESCRTCPITLLRTVNIVCPHKLSGPGPALLCRHTEITKSGTVTCNPC